jgi:UDP-N-acetylmuramoyl-L-alanyl-D-glutamate--2,6-diaminopimelate ligase
VRTGADLELIDSQLPPRQSRFTVNFNGRRQEFETQLVGGFQVENALAAIALLAGKGHSLESIAEALQSFPCVCGRMERFLLPSGATAIVDYAHNPDGLKHVLESSRLLCPGSLHVVFGCGGDRDRGKRPIMGEIASRIADVCWITSDNPRTEDPEKIIQDILDGIETSAVRIVEESDRKSAIEKACSDAGPADMVVIAGKGHEDYQLIGVTKHPFSDQEVLRNLGAS